MPIDDPFPFALNDKALEARLKRLFQKAVPAISGTSIQRPKTPPVGTMYFDTDLEKPVWWTGSHWKDAMGNIV